MGKLRHSLSLLRQLGGMARRHKSYWILPLAVILVIAVLAVFATQAAAPLVYSLW